ncbi:MAG TPA: hypothetical protein VKI99_06775 [Candidatus Dormibacteraeota bacterium]|nr:hypothetical protein [Candidatus Dormibacteraeota bacterium]
MIEWGDRYYSPRGPPGIVPHDGCGGHVTSSLVCDPCLLQAARAAADRVARLPASAVDKAVAENRLGLLDLSIHWDEHLEQIEKAIGRAI